MCALCCSVLQNVAARCSVLQWLDRRTCTHTHICTYIYVVFSLTRVCWEDTFSHSHRFCRMERTHSKLWIIARVRRCVQVCKYMCKRVVHICKRALYFWKRALRMCKNALYVGRKLWIHVRNLCLCLHIQTRKNCTLDTRFRSCFCPCWRRLIDALSCKPFSAKKKINLVSAHDGVDS